MAEIEELVIELSANTKDLQAQLKTATDAMKGATDQMSKSLVEFSNDSKKSTSVTQNAFSTMAGFIGGQVVIGAFKAVGAAVVDMAKVLISDGIAAAIESENALNQLNASLQRTGQFSKETSDDLADFANSLENASKFQDDAILSSTALISTLTRLDKDGLKAATQAAVDMAAALNIDLDSAARLVSKSIEGNGEALKRYGVVVEEGSTKSQNLANTLTALNTKFGGAAAAQVGTYSGSVDQLSKAFEDVTKEIGFAITKNPVVISLFQTLGNALKEVGSFLSQNAQGMRELVGQGILIAINAVKNLVDGLAGLAQLMGGFTEILATPFKILGTIIGSVGFLIQGKFKEAFDAMKSNAYTAAGEVGKAFTSTGVLDKISEKLGQAKTSAESAFASVQAGATASVGPTNNLTNATKLLSEEQIKYNQLVLGFAQGLAESADSSSEIYAMQLEQLQQLRANSLITDTEYFAQKEELLAQNILNEQMMLDQALATGQLSREQATAAQTALTMKSNADQLKLQAERTKNQEALDRKREQDFSSSLGTIATLASSGNKTLGAIGKAAAISQATIDGIAAVQKALAAAPPPVNFILAGAVGAATAANVAKIAGVPLQSGIDSVPGIGSRDNFPAVLAPGERVVPSDTNADLTNFLRQQANEPRTNIVVNVTMNDVFTSEPREMGLKLIQTINEAAQANGIRILGSGI